MNATFTRRWIVREDRGSLTVTRQYSDGSQGVEVLGADTSLLGEVEARNREEAERIAAAKFPGLKLDIIRA